LHNNDEWDGVFVSPGIPVDIELSHQSDEYSSAIEPDLELNLFHVATVASTTLAFTKRSLRSRSTNSDSNDSTTPERLSVIDLAWFTKSSFKVKLTGRLRAAALKPAFMFSLQYAHYMRITISPSIRRICSNKLCYRFNRNYREKLTNVCKRPAVVRKFLKRVSLGLQLLSGAVLTIADPALSA
jgi:hypothetical protein